MNQTNQTFLYEKVMVIDDSQIDRYVASYNLKKFFFAKEVIAMASAKEALQYLSELAFTPMELPQYIFLDIRMPEIDGFEFLEKYSELPEVIQRQCIIMMLSSSLNPDDHKRAEQNKFVKRFLNKPLNQEKLELLIQEHNDLYKKVS